MNYQEIKSNEEIRTYIRQADLSLEALGYTEHSFAHVTMVAEKAGLTIDTNYGSVMDYFEIFLQRMIMCRKAAEKRIVRGAIARTRRICEANRRCN